MVNSGTFEPPPMAEGEQPLEDELRCSVPLEKLDCLLNAHPQDDVSKTRSAASVIRKLLCLYCDRTFASVNLRQKHVERAHSSKSSRRGGSRKLNPLTATPCAYCDRLNTLEDLFEHLVRDHPTKYFGCLPCEERFLTAVSLADHQVLMHQEAVVKITRSRTKPKQQPPEEPKVKKLKKLKKRESKRLQAMAKTAEGGKKRGRKEELQQQGAKAEKTKAAVAATNSYPEFDAFYRVKKITDHSIDNLKIGSLTFDDVFDKAFFNRIKCNIEENLLHHIDGKLFQNEESENRISNFEKVSNTTPEIQTSSDNYGCELSLNAVTPVASLSLASQYGEDFESQIEYGARPASKKRAPTKSEPEFHYKYFTRRKFQASIQQQKENRDLSKLDMWTQLVIRKRQQRVVDDKKSPKERQEYAAGDEYKSKVRREELDRILDRRGPFEDLKEEASKKAALDNLNSGVSHESFSEVREVLDEVLERVFGPKGYRDKKEVEEKVCLKSEDERELPGYLSLRRASSLPVEGDVDPSDRIALICSSQETEDYELPTNRARRRDEPIELSGEWARCRMYVCAACGAKLPNMKYLIDHKSLYHQHVWVQHYEFVGSQNELYRHLSIPALGKVGLVEDSFQGKGWKRSEARTCSKCEKRCNSLGELHRHILECGGDWSWMMARKKCKYRPCKSRKKRLRGLVHRIRQKEKDRGPTEKKKYKKTLEGPRQRPSDAETIQRMLANLPAKRSTRKLISLYDGVRRARKNNQIQHQQNLIHKKVKCGKIIYKSSNIKENSEKAINVATSGLMSQKPGQSSDRRSLRNMSRVLSSKILDTNANLNVKRKLKALCEKRSTRQSKLADQIDCEQPAASNEEAKTPKRTSPRSAQKNLKMMNVKKLSTGNMNMKSFFPVKKQKTKEVHRENQTTGSADENEIIKTKIELKSIESEASAVANEEKVEKAAESETSKTGAVKKTLRSLSVKKKALKILTEKDAQEIGSNNESNHVVRERNRVKRLKIDSAAESLQEETKCTFLGETHVGHLSQNQSVKIVIPSNSEAKENLADISESAHIATNFSKRNGDSPVPENIFKLGSSDEKSLQAKGDLDFDSQHVTEKIMATDIKRKKTETEIPQNKPLFIEISEKTKVMPLMSPNIKGKIKKPTRGLNDCIAMLTSKLQQKTNEPAAKIGTFNSSCSKPPRILSDPSPQKSDCILKIPTFKTQKEPRSCLVDAALDLTIKPKNLKNILEIPTTSTSATNQLYFEPFHFDIPQMTSSVERIINSVIGNNFQKSWNAVDETIQCVIDGYHGNACHGTNSVDDIIDFVATCGQQKEDNNNRLSLILKQPGDRSHIKAAARKPSPTKKIKIFEGRTGDILESMSLISPVSHAKAILDSTLCKPTILEDIEDILVKVNDDLDATIESVVKDSPVAKCSVKKLSQFRRNKEKLKTIPTAPVETHSDDVLDMSEVDCKSKVLPLSLVIQTYGNVVEVTETENENETLILENKVVMQIHPSDSDDDVPLAVLAKPNATVVRPAVHSLGSGNCSDDISETNEEKSTLFQPLLLEASENKISLDGDITPDIGDKEACESQKELPPQLIEDFENKKPSSKKPVLSKKKRAPRRNVVFENDGNVVVGHTLRAQETQPEILEDMQFRELAVTTLKVIEEKTGDDMREQTSSLPETIPTLSEVKEIQAKDSVVRNIRTDSFIKSLPFANEVVLSEILPVSKRNAIPKKRLKKSKFSRKKPKKKSSLTVSDILEDILKPTSSLDLKLHDETHAFQSEIALATEPYEEVISTYGPRTGSLEASTILPERSLDETAITPEDATKVETVLVAEVIETKDAEKEEIVEHNLKIPLSDDFMSCEASEEKNVRIKTARTKVKTLQRSTHSHVKLRSRSLKKKYTEQSEVEDVLPSKIPTGGESVDEKVALTVDESVSIISKTLITLRKELGLPSEDIAESNKKSEEKAPPKRSARLSGFKPSFEVVEQQRVVDPLAGTLKGGKDVVALTVFRTPTEKCVAKKSYSLVSIDESDSSNKKISKSLRTVFDQSSSESEVDESFSSDGGFKTRTRSGSRSLVSDFEEPTSNGSISSFEREVGTEKTKLKKPSKRKCIPMESVSDRPNLALNETIEPTSNSVSDSVLFQHIRPLRKWITQKKHALKELLIDGQKEKEEMLIESGEIYNKRLQRSSELLNNNRENATASIDVEKLIVNTKLKGPRNNGRNESSPILLPDISHESVNEMEEISRLNIQENLEIVQPEDDWKRQQNSRSLRKKMTVNYSEMEERNIIESSITGEEDKSEMKNKFTNVGLFDIDPKTFPDNINTMPDIIAHAKAEESLLLKTAGSRKCGKNTKNGNRSKFAKQSERCESVATFQPSTNTRLDSLIPSEINEETETQPPIKLVINKQKASRKSKIIKKIDGKGPNDLFEDFALVIKKKRHPFMSFSPPDAFSKDDPYSLFLPKPLEVQQIADEADSVCIRRDEDQAELDVSVEEMDMELDEIPINSSIIENTLNLALSDEKSIENEYSISYDTPIVGIEPLPEPTVIKKETRNNRKSRNYKNKKCKSPLVEISELVNKQAEAVTLECTQFDTSIENTLEKCTLPLIEESDAKVECPTKVDEPKSSKRTSRKVTEKGAEFNISALPHESTIEKSQSIEVKDAKMKNTSGSEEPKSVKRKARKSKEEPEEMYTDSNRPEFSLTEKTVESGELVENRFEEIVGVTLEVEHSKTLTRSSKKNKVKSMEEYPHFDIPAHVANTLEKSSIREAEVEAEETSLLEAENPKILKKNLRKVKENSMKEYAEFDIPAFSQVENTLERSLILEAEVEAKITCLLKVENSETLKRNSRKFKENDEFDIPASSHVENTLTEVRILEAESDAKLTSSLEVQKPKTVKRNSRKAGGICLQEHAEFDIPALSHAENGEKNESLIVEESNTSVKNLLDVVNSKTVAECDITVSPPHMENSKEEKLLIDAISPIEIEEPVISRKANTSFVDFAAEFDSPALQYIETAIENIILVKEGFHSLGKNPVEALKQKRILKNIDKNHMEVYAKSELSHMKTDISIQDESNSIGKILTEVEETKPSQSTLKNSKEKCIENYAVNKPHAEEPLENHLPTVLDINAITEKTKSLKEVIKKSKGKPTNVKSSINHLDEMVTNCHKSTEVTSFETETHTSVDLQTPTEMLPSNSSADESSPLLNQSKYNHNQDKDIDLIYTFSETEDVEINSPIELPRRLPKNLDKFLLAVGEHDQKAKKKPRLRISAAENEDDKAIAVREIKENSVDLEENKRRKPMRSAKVKALENIHDDALAELTESERNRELKSLKATQNDIETNNKKNKKSKSQTVPQVNVKASFSYGAPAEDEAPLLAELVAELHGLEELENSIERELNTEMNDKTLNTTDNIPAESLPNIGTGTALGENQELRRSRRGSRKVASYNENDLIDPIIDALENKRNTKKRDTKLLKTKEPDKKLNSDQLFDLLKASTSTESTYVPKLQNSFLNNLVGVCSDINAKKIDTVFDELQEKNKDTEKIYDFNENSVTTEKEVNNSLLVSKQTDESSSSNSSYKLLTPDIQDSSTSEETETEPAAAAVDSNYCEICNKSFIRVENLVKHRRTLTHIQKLSEIEAKEAEMKLHQEQTVQEISPEFSTTHSLKLADIISDVLNKPVLGEEASKFPDIVLQSTSDPEIKRYKSLGERKSFESDPLTFESKTTILEKQISLLENIIENKGNTSYKDDISVSSEDSALSANKPPAFKAHNDVDSFLKPTQYEEISEDSANLRPYDDPKLRKTLNRDEELFLECCSLLKSGSEVSSSYSSKRMAPKEAGGTNVRQSGWVAEKRNLVEKPELHYDHEYSDDYTRVPTPLGDSFDDDASNSNTISSSWGLNEKEVCVKEHGSPRLNFQGISVEKREASCELKFQDLLEKERSPLTFDLPTRSTTSEVNSKKIITKGARKVFEGLKVSIPTEELNLEEVLNCSPKLCKPDSDKLSPKPTKSARKSKPVKKAQVGSNILFKVNKKKLPSPNAVVQPGPEKWDKSFDVYDFEDTQDNTDVFARPDFKSFRNTKTGDNDGDSEPDSLVTSRSQENNITKKKCMIMGRIFKNAAKSKIEDIDEEMRSIPSMNNGELVENYVASCSKEADAQLFDELLDDRASKPKSETKRRRQKVKGKKRTRGNSVSTDDEFGLSIAKRRSGKKEDNCINLEQELRECIGVASRKSQRSCTSGKQNVLVEHWSSDESVVEERPPEAKPPKRRKRAAANPLYHWSSSSEDEGGDLVEVKAVREEEEEEDRPVQHGWIVGESPKKLVMMLAQAKGKKSDADSVKELGKKRASAGS